MLITYLQMFERKILEKICFKKILCDPHTPHARDMNQPKVTARDLNIFASSHPVFNMA